jgi:hypothetical protein
MATIKVNANIREVNRYEFIVEIDENLPKEEQHKQAIAKVGSFLDENTPYIYQKEPVNGVLCCDMEASCSGCEVEEIEISCLQ